MMKRKNQKRIKRGAEVVQRIVDVSQKIEIMIKDVMIETGIVNAEIETEVVKKKNVSVNVNVNENENVNVNENVKEKENAIRNVVVHRIGGNFNLNFKIVKV